MKYTVYLKSGLKSEISCKIPHIKHEGRIFFCKSEEQAEKLKSSNYDIGIGNYISYFEESEIAGMDHPNIRAVASGIRTSKEKVVRTPKYQGY